MKCSLLCVTGNWSLQQKLWCKFFCFELKPPSPNLFVWTITQRSCVWELACGRRCNIIGSVKAETQGKGLYLGQSMSVHFLSRVDGLAIKQSHYVGWRTILTHLLCSRTKRLLPTRRQRVLTVHLPTHGTSLRWLCEKRTLWQRSWLSLVSLMKNATSLV